MILHIVNTTCTIMVNKGVTTCKVTSGTLAPFHEYKTCTLAADFLPIMNRNNSGLDNIVTVRSSPTRLNTMYTQADFRFRMIKSTKSSLGDTKLPAQISSAIALCYYAVSTATLLE